MVPQRRDTGPGGLWRTAGALGAGGLTALLVAWLATTIIRGAGDSGARFEQPVDERAAVAEATLETEPSLERRTRPEGSDADGASPDPPVSDADLLASSTLDSPLPDPTGEALAGGLPLTDASEGGPEYEAVTSPDWQGPLPVMGEDVIAAPEPAATAPGRVADAEAGRARVTIQVYGDRAAPDDREDEQDDDPPARGGGSSS
ncbi:MAG: hypothetical protein MJB57_11355 [Gemmatimonadetes bacterium]|nr:hypothetical protein [Gemmatimonadota bacterium]